MEREVNKWIIENNWNVINNPPEYYHPYRVGDMVIVLGKSGGVAVVPYYSTYLAFMRIIQCDEGGDYWVECDGPEPKNAVNLLDEIEIHKAALKYCRLYATRITDEKGEIRGFTLPWVAEKQTFSKEL